MLVWRTATVALVLVASASAAAAHDGSPFVRVAEANARVAEDGSEARCAGLDEGARPRYRHFVCVYYLDRSYLGGQDTGWQFGGGFTLHAMSAGGLVEDSANFGVRSPRRRRFVTGSSPRLALSLAVSFPRQVSIVSVSRPTRRIRVAWTVLCGIAESRPTFVTRTGDYAASRRGQHILQLPMRPRGCMVAATASAVGRVRFLVLALDARKGR